MTCPREGKWFGGCRFEGRYDTQPTRKIGGDELFWSGGWETQARLVQSQRKMTYVRDVCVRCGKTVERNK